LKLPAEISSTRSIGKIGHITPSCNSALEHITSLVAAPLAQRVSNHYTRIPVGTISLSDSDRGQFDTETMLCAARLLADAAMDVILWNGTSACWNGTAADGEICEAITRETGMAASTTILAQYEVFARFGIRTFGLAVPYTDDVTAKSVETFREAGYDAVSHANIGLTVGRDMAYVPFAEIRDLIRAADAPDAECVIVVCTGLPAAFVVEEMEQELGKPVFDSVLVTAWKGLEAVGVTEPLEGWGCLLRGARRFEPAGDGRDGMTTEEAACI
jgi:maleate isomerase